MSGSERGRRLAVPPGVATRPTSDRVRESMFNALESLDAVRDARVLDAFAGSGALGIEALSRGAGTAVFADLDASARRTVEANLAELGLEDRGVVRPAAAEQVVRDGPWDLVLLDPPYAYEGWDPLLADVAGNLAAHGVVVVESDRAVELPGPLAILRQKRYGGTVVTFARLPGDAA